MSHSTSLPLAHLKRLTAVLEAADGSKTQKELIPLMRRSLSVGRASPPSEEVISDTIRAVQQRVKHRHDRQRKKEAEEARIAALEEQAVNTRARRRSSAAASDISTSASRRSNKVRKVEVTAQTRAEDKLAAALAELRVRNVNHTEEQRKLVAEEKKARAASKAAERKERKEKEAQEKKEQKEKTAAEREKEAELRESIRLANARGGLEAAAKKHSYEDEEREAQQRRKRIDNKLEILIDLETEALQAARGRKRAREAPDEESEEDKENIEPEGEWRV